MIRRSLQRITSPPALRVIGTASLCLWSFAYVSVYGARVIGADRRPVVGGDFCSFYAAGRILLIGRGASLYDHELQRQMQRRALQAGEEHRAGPFVYPPSFALAYVPFAALPYPLAFHFHTACMLAAFAVMMRMLRPKLPGLHRYWPTVWALSLSFFPIVRTVVGGQNTVLSLVLIVGALCSLKDERPVRAGVFLGLLLFKPHFALPLIGLVALRGQLKTAWVACMCGLCHLVISTAICGLGWPMALLAEVQQHMPTEPGKLVSWIGACEYGFGRGLGRDLGLLLAGATAVAVLCVWREADPADPSFALRWAVAVCGVVLVSPHTQFYDAGLTLLAVLVGLHHVAERGLPVSAGVRAALIAGYVFFPFYTVSSRIHFQPLVFLPAAAMAWLWLSLEARLSPIGVSRQ